MPDDLGGVPVSMSETIGVHGRRFDSYQVDPRYPTHVALPVARVALLADVVQAARGICEFTDWPRGALCDALAAYDADAAT